MLPTNSYRFALISRLPKDIIPKLEIWSLDVSQKYVSSLSLSFHQADLFLTLQVQPRRWKVDANGRLDAVLMLSYVNLPGGVQVS